MILVEVVVVHTRKGFFNDCFHLEKDDHRLIGRLGGASQYATTQDRFTIRNSNIKVEIMPDYLFFLRAGPGQADALHDWLLTNVGPRVAASENCTNLCINIGVKPRGGPTLYANEPREGDFFDASLDFSCPNKAAFARLMEEFGSELSARTVENFGYLVRRQREKDEPDRLVGNPAPGYKIMRGFFFFEDLPQSARQRSWNNHVNLAMCVHGFARYDRYWVENPVTDGAPAIGGATNLHFADEDTWKQDYFRVENGSMLIKQDISHFIEKGLARIFTKEYRLK